MTEVKGLYWKRSPEVENLFLDMIAEWRKKSPAISRFEKRLFTHTSTRLLDWIDHILMPDSEQLRQTLDMLGFVGTSSDTRIAYAHPGVYLPSVVLMGNDSAEQKGFAVRVESISDFLQANKYSADIEGSIFSPYRRAEVSRENSIKMFAIERRGTRTFEPVYTDECHLRDYLAAIEAWKNIPRWLEDEQAVFNRMFDLATRLIETLGQDLAAQVVCMAERDYWLSRNFAGRLQKSRHDVLGLGWANHDHHTFRSSRRHFSSLINLFTLLGFDKRERFYAGGDAGWGAQVMENREAGLTLFLDVDLSPEEVNIDFSANDLEERETLGTVGLWCALHGDSILKAGMHHLAALFEFDRLIADLADYRVQYMAPFSDFSYLKQAFSVAEMWPVDASRIQHLLDEHRISPKQADTFLQHGSVGSHLENIERREGYKGFNKKNVSAIIREIDPRKQGDSS